MEHTIDVCHVSWTLCFGNLHRNPLHNLMLEFCKCVSCYHVLCDNIIMLEWFLCSDWTTLCFYNQNEFSETLKYTIICFNFQRDWNLLPLSKGRSWQNLISKLTFRYHIKWYHILNAFSREISDQPVFRQREVPIHKDILSFENHLFAKL